MDYTDVDTFSLKRLMDKQARYRSHLEFLDTCTHMNIIPKGFLLKWELQLEAGDEDFEKCRKIKIDAANQLMGVTRDVCLKKLNELEGEINHFYSMLDSNEKKSIDIWYVERTLENKLRKLKKVQQLKSKINKDEDVRTYKIISVAKDGNCFYRCLSYFLYGSQMYHESLREDLTQYMYKNSLKYNHLVDGDIHVHLSAQRYTNGR
ncbi:hypothetical protein DPMN_146434 [Dreissena polymorpha]|uniref:OTU domain-containing protein n=1 Tax=Dreissena polymorpha TaxID=45954 RepID=A0A9D4J233_DREPO|nr:hypothetical protein DPMN_146434 [Dreissena polymorpha]